ncbi:hypothetical protein BH09CHL1_BH09CHL1_15320 [soil metagenome]
MIARILVSLGFPVSAIGLVIFGMATAESIRNDDQANLGLYLMFGGFIVGIIGVLWYRANEARADQG